VSLLAAARSLEFLWPAMLWALAAVPLLAALYLRLLARRRALAGRYASLETAGQPAGALRRHLPALLLLLGVCAMLLALARPQAKIVLPAQARTVVVAIDISGSMRATDLKPNRLKAAQDAARTFVSEQPAAVRIGVVAIAGTAAVVQAPTPDREDATQAIGRLQPQRGTALGNGLVISLVTLLPGAGIDAQAIIHGTAAPPRIAQPAEGAESVAIVLFSDGAANMGTDLQQAGQLAADLGVRVFALGIGTPEGATVSAEGWSIRARLEEAPLKKLAGMTGGEYWRGGSPAQIGRIYERLGMRLALEKAQATEVSALFAGLGAALAMLAAMLSMRWFNRIL